MCWEVGHLTQTKSQALITLIQNILHETESRKIQVSYLQQIFKPLSIDFCVLFQVLKKFGFNDYFINWIRILHNNSYSSVMNGGYSTGYFKLERGTKQGDPLAPYLLF